MRCQQSVFCQLHSSRTSHNASTDWLQYAANLVTKVLVNFQQKTNLSLKNQLDPQIVLSFSDHIQYVKFYLFYVYSDFCAGNIFEHENQ